MQRKARERARARARAAGKAAGKALAKLWQRCSAAEKLSSSTGYYLPNFEIILTIGAKLEYEPSRART